MPPCSFRCAGDEPFGWEMAFALGLAKLVEPSFGTNTINVAPTQRAPGFAGRHDFTRRQVLAEHTLTRAFLNDDYLIRRAAVVGLLLGQHGNCAFAADKPEIKTV